MSSELTVHDMAARLTNFPHDRYLYIGGFMRSVAWAAGTIVLLQILRQPRKYAPRLLPWMVSFLATMVTLMTWGRGILLTNSSASVGDSFFPTFMGITEFCLFAMLSPREEPKEPETKARSLSEFLKYLKLQLSQLTAIPVELERLKRSSDLKPRSVFRNDLVTIWKNKRQNWRAWHAWFFALSLHTFLAVCLISTRMSNTNLQEDFEPCLKPLESNSLPQKYWTWMVDDRQGASRGTVAFIVLGLLMILTVNGFKSANKLSHPILKKRIVWAAAFILLFAFPTGLFSYVVIQSESQRRDAETEVFKLEYDLRNSCNRNQYPPPATPTPSPTPRVPVHRKTLPRKS